MNTLPVPCGTPLGEHARVVGDIESFLREMIGALKPEPLRVGPGRPRILPALALWAGLLVCVLRGFTSQLDLWRLLTLHQLWFYHRFPVTDQAIDKRLEEGGATAPALLFAQTSQVFAVRPAAS